MVSLAAQEWMKQGEARGEAQGIVEGEAKMLIRLVEKRFGPLSTNHRERILSADPATIEAWGDRLMEANSIEALLESPN